MLRRLPPELHCGSAGELGLATRTCEYRGCTQPARLRIYYGGVGIPGVSYCRTHGKLIVKMFRVERVTMLSERGTVIR